jgi:protoporphyrinogen oxidase
MLMKNYHVAILGAGPAGLGAAYRLAQLQGVHITVLEQNARVGGNAGSFELAGMKVDFGSHRLHPACDPQVLKDIRLLLGGDLLDRPRHGRIYLSGRWIHFPLKPVDLALRLPPSFSFGVANDILRKLTHHNKPSDHRDTFASVMEKDLGCTICRDFYFPYARKIWGLDPEELSSTQARRRVSNNSLLKMFRKVLSAVPGFKPEGSGRFFYPRYGYGQISEAFAQAALQAGANLNLNARVKTIQRTQNPDGSITFAICFEKDGRDHLLDADYVWSTIPITILSQILNPGPPQELIKASRSIDYRAMILIYLVLEQSQFSQYDAHYFPSPEIRITRLSEPKIYSNGQGPENRTVLCAELPCSHSDPVWELSDEGLGELVCESLKTAGLPVTARVSQVLVKRLRFAYPIYRDGYETHFNRLDDWLSQMDGLLTFGRQGLFAHDNTHHALFMAYSAVACLGEDGKFDKQRWHEYRAIFNTHVVED